MKLIGKMDDFLVYEVDRGRYIIVDPEGGRWKTEWTWYGQLGKWCDSFVKCSEDEDDEKCVEVIISNQDDILKSLNKLRDLNDGEDDEIERMYLKEQEEFYDGLEEGRKYDWFKGDYAE